MLRQKLFLAMLFGASLSAGWLSAATSTDLVKSSSARNQAKSRTSSYNESFVINGITINPSFIIDLYNVAQSNNNVITSLPPAYNAFSSIVNLSVQNNGPNENFYFQLSGSYQSCSNLFNETLGTGIIGSTNGLASGSNTLGLANLEVYNNSFSNFSASSCLQNSLGNAFQNVNNISQAVNILMTTTFNICVTAYDPFTGGGRLYGPTKCTTLTFFSQNGNNIGSAPIIILPHNNGICGLPRFVWTQAVYQGQIASNIPYILKVCQDSPDGKPVETINIPAGQCYYQWAAKDPVLLPNVKYYFTVIAIGPTGSPLFATSKVWKWFIINCVGVNLQQVGTIIGGYFNGPGAKNYLAPIVQKLTIKGVVGSSGLGNPIFTQLQNGTAKINNITLVQ